MPCNLYGIGDNYDVENGHVLPTLIAKFVKAKEEGADSVVLWGDGSPLREFLFSDDLADAVVRTFSIPDEKLPNLMNIGSSEEISIRELAEVVKGIVGFKGGITWDKDKPNGTPRKVMDSSLFMELTNWRPSTTIERGIARCHEDYLRNRDRPGTKISNSEHIWEISSTFRGEISLFFFPDPLALGVGNVV